MAAERAAPAELFPWEQKLTATLMVVATAFSTLPSGLSWGEIDFQAATSGSLAFQMQWGSLFGLAGLLILRHGGQTLAVLRRCNPFLLLLAAWAMATVLWSALPAVSVKKAVEFWGLIALALVAQFDARVWSYACKYILLSLTAIMVASALVALTVPSLGIDAFFGYAWRGLLVGKNALGGIGALCLVIWVGMWQLEGLKRSTWWCGAGISALCVVMSTSSTGITVAAIGVTAYWLMRRSYISSPLSAMRLLVALVMLIVLSLHLFYVFEGRLPARAELLGPFAGLFGKGADLTGRSDIWEPLMVEIDKHWQFGIGYGCFWLGPGSPSQPIIDAVQWIPNEGHNGFLDLLNEMGVVGLGLFLCTLLAGARSLFLMSRFDRRGAALLGALLIAMLVHNLTETTIPLGVSFQFFLFIFCIVSASNAVARQAVAAPASAEPDVLAGRALTR